MSNRFDRLIVNNNCRIKLRKEWTMDFDKKIIELRKQNNLTQEDLAEKLNVSRQTVSNWETAKCYPDIETLVIISNKFNLNLSVYQIADDFKFEFAFFLVLTLFIMSSGFGETQKIKGITICNWEKSV